jgi:hypothetical protein
VATPDKIRRRARLLLTLGAIAALAVGGNALADNVEADGDGVAPVANNNMAVGNVNCGVATNETARIAISRNGKLRDRERLSEGLDRNRLGRVGDWGRS